WYSRPSQDGWVNNDWSNALCVAEADDTMPFTGSLSRQPEPVSAARKKVKAVPLSAVSMTGASGYSQRTVAPQMVPLTTATNLPPAPCGSASPSADWFGSSSTYASYQFTQNKKVEASVTVAVAPLTRAGAKSLRGYLKNLPSSCYVSHWFSFEH